jgi:hypothetical protein
MHYLLGQPRAVLEGLANVFRLQVWIGLNNLIGVHTVGNEVNDQRHGDTHTPNAGASPHNLGIKNNAIKAQHGNPPVSCFDSSVFLSFLDIRITQLLHKKRVPNLTLPYIGEMNR